MFRKTALGRILERNKKKKIVKQEAQRLGPLITKRLSLVLTAIGSLPAGTLANSLLQRHGEYTRLLANEPSDPWKAEEHWKLLDEKSQELLNRANSSNVPAKNVDTWCTTPMRDLEALVGQQGAEVKELVDAELKRLRQRAAACDAALQAESFADAQRIAGEVYWGADTLTGAVPQAAAYVLRRSQVQPQAVAAQTDKTIVANASQQLQRLAEALQTMNDLAADGYYPEATLACDDVDRVRKIVEGSSAGKGPYDTKRGEVVAAVKKLRSHAQAAAIKEELDAVEKKLLDADRLGADRNGGWQKATVMLGTLMTALGEAARTAERMEEQAIKIPGFAKQLEGEGIDPTKARKVAHHAAKILCDEACSDDDALAMAKDAEGFIGEGIPEPDALMSARVKKSLVASGVPEDKATEVGRNMRRGGHATAEDTKTVAKELSRLSKPALEQLNKAGVTTVSCHGAVTEVVASSAGENPRGWPAHMTWDDVPGMCRGGNPPQVIIGTMDAGGGTRKVPGPGEGPLKHGTPDLVGHEAGHAFDAAGGGTLKNTNVDFNTARSADRAGTPPAMQPPRDNYFLASAEGGRNTAGALSETFAESFAMHFAGNAKWPELERFWAGNPWKI